jgi:hypothetical protein
VGSAQALATNPGNELIFEFTLNASQALTFEGFLSQPLGFNPATSFISLQQFDGNVFQNVFTTNSLPGSQGSFLFDQTVSAGSWRILSQLSMSGSANFGPATAEFQFALSAVPEPHLGLCSGLLLLAAMSLRRRA